MATVTGGAAWRAALDSEGSVWRLSFTCPTCGRGDAATLQPLPWHAPALDAGEDPDEPGITENERVVRSHRLEQRRASETGIPHAEVYSISTQLWCHLDLIGHEVLIST